MKNNIILFIVFIILLILAINIYLGFQKKDDKLIGEKTIWCYWDQGIENIYPFYKLCLQTWKEKNPYNSIIVVDKYNVYNFIDKKELPPNWEKIKSVQIKSDFVRLALLEKYGGIWCDISVICLRPINSIFKQEKEIEGFAIKKFSRNNDLSVFENWFITAKKGSKIIKRWKEEMLRIFGDSVSVEEMDKTPFENVDLQNIEFGWNLTMHRVMMKLNQLDPEIRYLYYNDSNILDADSKALQHYFYFGFNYDITDKLLQQNDELLRRIILSGTPIIKFTSSGGKLKKLSREEILDNKSSLLYKLLKFKA